MNLGFRQNWQLQNMPIHMAGKRTLFVEQINNSLLEAGLVEKDEVDLFERTYSARFGFNLRETHKKKKHTIRHDSKNRWKAGSLIHFVINNRTPQRFQFAPVVEVKSVQEIFIKYEFPNNKDFKPNVFIDNQLLDIKQVYELAINDGFDSVDDFFSWFKEDFTGKIIHWTSLKY